MSRKRFIEILFLVTLIPFIWLLSVTIRRKRKWTIPAVIHIPDTFTQEVTFLNKVIVIKKVEDAVFLSSSCTHLGCKINKLENGELLCPCHGSRFSKSGQVLKGPANDPLPQFNHHYQEKSNEYIVEIRS